MKHESILKVGGFCGLLVWTAGVAGCAALERGADPLAWSSLAQEVAVRRLAAVQGGDDPAAPGIEAPGFRLAADQVEEYPLDENATPSDTGEVSTGGAAVERGPLPGFLDTVKRDLKEAPGLLWQDTKKVFGDPLNLVFLLGAGGVSLALRAEVEDDIEDYYDHTHSFKEDWRDAFGAAGNPVTHFALAGVWYLVGQQSQDAKTYEVGKRMVSALTITGVTTMFLKVAANTESPNGEELGWPSGHVSSTMAMATVLNDAYGPVVGVPMFGLTALVGAERLDSGEHHLSDLIFGAALGWVVAETVMKEHRPEIFGGQIVPYADPVNGTAGVAWFKSLGN